MKQPIFLTAEWRKLVMFNYIVDPSLLIPFTPKGTELDLWNQQCYVSLVGFMFKNTRLKGFKIPFHTDFEEVNLRFYVRFCDQGTWKRGVVFIKEIVPKPALTWVANTLYQEHYETMPMQHRWTNHPDSLTIEYHWKKKRWHHMAVTASLTPFDIHPDSEEEFITEHYWGYTQTQSHTSEYGVEHPRWQVYPTKTYSLDVDFMEVYGNSFSILNSMQPSSVFLAEGSDILVRKGRTIV